MFDIINALGELQDNLLKNDQPLRFTVLVSYTVELHWKGSNKSSPKFSRRCIIALGWHTYDFST